MRKFLADQLQGGIDTPALATPVQPVDELAAHAMLGNEIRDQFRTRQRPNGQVATFALRQASLPQSRIDSAHASAEKWGASIGHGSRLPALRRVTLG